MSLPLTDAKSAEAKEMGKIHHLYPSLDSDVKSYQSEIRVVSSIPEIELLESSWRRLTPENSAPFQTFTWNLAWYRHYRDSYDAP
ncbi:MAG: hypothetical protein AAF733_10045, partial [Verrucomicrobiota bacterium]